MIMITLNYLLILKAKLNELEKKAFTPPFFFLFLRPIFSSLVYFICI